MNILIAPITTSAAPVDPKDFDVTIRKDFKPSYKRSLKFVTTYTGTTKVSDRGLEADIYDTSFTIIGDTTDIEEIAEMLIINDAHIVLSADSGEQIFGSGIKYTSAFDCIVTNKATIYPIRDVLTSTLSLSVRVLGEIPYDLTVTPTLPEMLYTWPINRSTVKRQSGYNAINIASSNAQNGVNSISTGIAPIEKETASFNVTLCNDDFAHLQRFISVTRGDTFTLSTSLCLKLFVNALATDQVKLTAFAFKPISFKEWEASLTLINVK
jgi:hypothetical protein